jgi:hypothetical protein
VTVYRLEIKISIMSTQVRRLSVQKGKQSAAEASHKTLTDELGIQTAADLSFWKVPASDH